jgi:hypothetical protein
LRCLDVRWLRRERSRSVTAIASWLEDIEALREAIGSSMEIIAS